MDNPRSLSGSASVDPSLSGRRANTENGDGLGSVPSAPNTVLQ
ncbi:unnamed protein product [Linum tenue]|uniref:Uncharacterized protein n=1 Tax=Linum tenue TaxID=586396 RepID=A0AAV0IS67_9ROSI|nr:unnamed protein product [Linum tenue]